MTFFDKLNQAEKARVVADTTNALIFDQNARNYPKLFATKKEELAKRVVDDKKDQSVTFHGPIVNYGSLGRGCSAGAVTVTRGKEDDAAAFAAMEVTGTKKRGLEEDTTEDGRPSARRRLFHAKPDQSVTFFVEPLAMVPKLAAEQDLRVAKKIGEAALRKADEFKNALYRANLKASGRKALKKQLKKTQKQLMDFVAYANRLKTERAHKTNEVDALRQELEESRKKVEESRQELAAVMDERDNEQHRADYFQSEFESIVHHVSPL